MADQIYKDGENDFTKSYCTDDLHKKIISELSTRKKGEKTGLKINLLPETLHLFLFHVSTGKTVKRSANLVGLNEKTVYNWKSTSDTFKEVIDLAESNVVDAALEAVYKAITGTKPGYYMLKHPTTGNTEYITVKETPPNVSVAQWLLEKKKYFGNDDGPTAPPMLGAPRNEEEAKLLEMLLNNHSDYVRSKQQQTSK